MPRFDDLIARGRDRWGDRFDASALEPAFRRWYGTDERVKVEYRPDNPAAEPMYAFGTIGATTGWRPAFLLMHNTRSTGSSYVIGPRDRVVAVKRGSKYVSLED